ncbi:MAG: hypothetical protein KF754_05655 [Planctomycetes bacterium]|nr:hypothetical protein [Planctomycetota bacterium]
MLACLLWLSSCAETDPYKRLDPAPTPRLTVEEAVAAYDSRWPEQFKAVQTVTLDFGPVTRTLVGYLIVQQPGRFRLQGMTEQGIKLFDIVDGGVMGPEVAFAVDEFDRPTLEQIAADIWKVFLQRMDSPAPQEQRGPAWLEYTNSGTELTVKRNHGENVIFRRARLVGADPRVDWVRAARGAELYRANYYEWKEFGPAWVPSVIVLRNRGVQPKGPAYKLTIQITEFTVRDKPWPEKTFELRE